MASQHLGLNLVKLMVTMIRKSKYWQHDTKTNYCPRCNFKDTAKLKESNLISFSYRTIHPIVSSADLTLNLDDEVSKDEIENEIKKSSKVKITIFLK